MLPVRSTKINLLLLLCFLNSLSLTGCSPNPRHFGVIVNSYSTVGPTDIYRIPDNTQGKLERLTFTPTIGEYDFVVSKDGDKIYFKTGPTRLGLAPEPSDLAIEQLGHIYLLDPVSKKLKDMTDIFVELPITSPMDVADLSPNQTQFAVITYKGVLELIDADGANKEIINIPSPDKTQELQDVKWSPDGKKLALWRSNSFLAYPENLVQELLVYDLGSERFIQLATDHEMCGGIWSPTSQQIAAICGPRDATSSEELVGRQFIRIFSVENPGQSYEHLLSNYCNDPVWSPDGKQIAFGCRKSTGQWGLFVINSDGTGIHEVIPENLQSSVSVLGPSWSPDGTQFVYVASTDGGKSKIYSVNLDGSNNIALTNQEGFYTIVSVYPVP